MLWAKNPEWGRKVLDVVAKLDSLHIPFKQSKKATAQGKKGTFDGRVMAYLLKWSKVSDVNPDGTVIDEIKERRAYLYIQTIYKGEYLFPSWQAVCGERRLCYDSEIPVQEMADSFAVYLRQQDIAA